MGMKDRAFFLFWIMLELLAFGSGLALKSPSLGLSFFLCFLAAGTAASVKGSIENTFCSSRIVIGGAALIALFALLFLFPGMTAPAGFRLLFFLLFSLEISALAYHAVLLALSSFLMLIMTVHLILITLVAGDAGIFLVILAYTLSAIPFCLHAHAAYFSRRRFQKRVFGTGNQRMSRKRKGSGTQGLKRTASWRISLTLFLLSAGPSVMLFLFVPRWKDQDSTSAGDAGIVAGGTKKESEGTVAPGSDRPTGRVLVSGFSETALLAMAEGMRLDNTEVLTVRCFHQDNTPYEPEGLLYMRGITLDEYRNGRWTNRLDFRQLRDADDGEQDGWIREAGTPADGRLPVLQQVDLQPIRSSVVFGAPEIIAVAASDIRSDGNGTMRFSQWNLDAISYTTVSHVFVQEKSALEGVENTPRSDRYTTLNDSFDRTASLARELVSDEPDLLRKCLRIERFLRTNFSYSLKAFKATSRDPVEAFLFVRKQGCCVHFSASMIVLLRSLGIPSRMACGFAGGKKGKGAGEYVFQRKHAHAWVEVYFGDYGWIRFDPSPAVNANPALALNRSAVLPTSLGDRIMSYGNTERRKIITMLFTRIRTWWFLPAAFLVICLAAVMVRKKATGKGKSTFSRNLKRRMMGKKAGVPFYEQFLRIVRPLGIIRRNDSTTPRELAGKAAAVLPPRHVDFITETYYAVRYGNHTLDSSEKGRIKESLAILKKILIQRDRMRPEK